jgi:hypothetical protein
LVSRKWTVFRHGNDRVIVNALVGGRSSDRGHAAEAIGSIRSFEGRLGAANVTADGHPQTKV